MINDKELNVLLHSFKELSIQDAIRKTERMSLPSESMVVKFNIIAKGVMNKLSRNFESHKKDVVGFFGAPIIVIAKLWELILENNNGDEKRLSSNKEHLLWALHYMKQSPNISVFCKTLKKDGKPCPDKKTVLKWVWFYINEIRSLQDSLIVWENRKNNDRGDDCLVSVDCIDCQFQQILINNPDKPGKKMRNKALYSFKHNGPALRYEVAVSLLSNDIVWINGPFCPGDWNDVDIFKNNLIYELEPGERIEADDGYVGEAPEYVVCPKSVTTKEEALATMRRVEGRHEALNKHIKNWKCLKGYFEVRGTPFEKMEKHSKLFRSCAIITQIAMQLGIGELYEI